MVKNRLLAVLVHNKEPADTAGFFVEVVSPEPGAVHQARNTHLHPRPFWSNRIAHEIPHTGFHGHSYFRPQPHIFKALYNDADEVKRIFKIESSTTLEPIR
jgi:hypothetical protein